MLRYQQGLRQQPRSGKSPQPLITARVISINTDSGRTTDPDVALGGSLGLTSPWPWVVVQAPHACFVVTESPFSPFPTVYEFLSFIFFLMSPPQRYPQKALGWFLPGLSGQSEHLSVFLPATLSHGLFGHFKFYIDTKRSIFFGKIIYIICINNFVILFYSIQFPPNL